MSTSPYATPAELASQIDVDLTKYSAQVTTLLQVCSEAVNKVCKRPNGFVANDTFTSKLFVGDGTPIQRIPDCVAISSVAVKKSLYDTVYTTWLATDWLPFSGGIDNPNFQPLDDDEPKPYTGIMTLASGNYNIFTDGRLIPGVVSRKPTRTMPTIQVTAKWGYAVVVPNPVKQAVLILASRYFKRSQAVWADALARSDFQELRFVSETDPAFDWLLEPYKRVAIA